MLYTKYIELLQQIKYTEMETFNLPGICKVEFLHAASITLYPKQHLHPGATISVIGIFAKLPMVGNASINYTNEDTDAGTVYNTVISGTLLDRPDISQSVRDQLIKGNYVYKVTDLHKNSYLVGTDKRPYPMIVFIPNSDKLPSGVRAIDFTINWRSTLPPLKIVAL